MLILSTLLTPLTVILSQAEEAEVATQQRETQRYFPKKHMHTDGKTRGPYISPDVRWLQLLHRYNPTPWFLPTSAKGSCRLVLSMFLTMQGREPSECCMLGPRLVKEEFLYLAMPIQSAVPQSFFFSYVKNNPLPIHPKSDWVFKPTPKKEHGRVYQGVKRRA